MRRLLFAFMLALTPVGTASCKPDAEIVTLTGVRVTAAGIAEAAHLYHVTLPKIIAAFQGRATLQCSFNETLDQECYTTTMGKHYSVMRKIDAALIMYAQAIKAGANVNSGEFVRLVGDLVDGFAYCGIIIKAVS